MNPRKLINGALRVARAIDKAEILSGPDEAEGLEALNMMLGAWFSNGMAVPYTVTENLTLVDGTASYAIGTGATFDTVYPEKILSGTRRDSDGFDVPLRIVTQRSYWEGLIDKTTEAPPKLIFYDALNATGKLYLYPTPDAAYTLILISQKNLAEITSLTADIAIPRVYEEAIKFNLAVRLAPEHGVPVTQEMILLAQDSFKLMERHSLLRDAPAGVKTSFKYSRNSGNIRTDGE